MSFIPSTIPPGRQIEPAWWFVFQQNALLVKMIDDTAQIPFLVDLSKLSLTPIRTQYLGTLDGRHCYSAEIADNKISTPHGMTFQELRPLFELLTDELWWLAGRAFQIMHWDRTHQYCGKCGCPTRLVPGEHAKVCPECGLTQYPRVSPAIIVAIIKERQILLAGSTRFRSQFYSVLAGFVEPGETFEECVRREVKEEVGIDVKNIRYFGSQPWPFPHSMMVGFTAQYASGDIRVDGVEISDAAWFSADNLPSIPGKLSISRKLIDWFVEQYSLSE